MRECGCLETRKTRLSGEMGEDWRREKTGGGDLSEEMCEVMCEVMGEEIGEKKGEEKRERVI